MVRLSLSGVRLVCLSLWVTMVRLNDGEIESVTWSKVNLCMFTFVGSHGEIESW